MKRICLLILFVIAVLFLPAGAKRLTHGFRLSKLKLDFPSQPNWETPFDPAVKPILEQPFFFLGKGAQSYVFESEDGKYVIKLFRYEASPPRSKIIILFNACKVAYDRLKEETGLIYIHLNPTQLGLPILKCKDAIGRSYRLPLDQYRFAVQKKARSFRQVLQEVKNDPPQMEKRIDQFIALLDARTSQNVYNSDPNLSRNFGFLEDRAIEFDFGNYRACAEVDRFKEVHRYAARLHRWLEKEAPEWIPYLEARVDSLF